MTSPVLRSQVLSLYKRILHLANKWKAQDLSGTAKEKQYIRNEAATLIRKNQKITDEVEIKRHILEAEARIEMALHYRNPYPRPINIPQTELPPIHAKKMKGRKKLLEQVKPVHIKSYETD